MPTVSVVIPAYQAARVIGQAIASALGQSAPPFEVVVCDDGSTDDLEAALAPYRDRIVVVQKANGGGASALNAAIATARGEFVSWLDADDAYLPDRLAAIAELAGERPDLDILMTDSFLEADGRVVGTFSTTTPFAATDQRRAILDRCFIAWPAIRRASVLDVGGLDESLRIAYDWDLWVRMLQQGARAGLIQEPLHRYRISAESLSGNRPAAARERVAVLEKAARSGRVAPEERDDLARSLAHNRRRAELAEFEAALRDGAPALRKRAAVVAAGRGFGRRTRLRAALTATFPKATHALSRRRESAELRRSFPGS